MAVTNLFYHLSFAKDADSAFSDRRAAQDRFWKGDGLKPSPLESKGAATVRYMVANGVGEGNRKQLL